MHLCCAQNGSAWDKELPHAPRVSSSQDAAQRCSCGASGEAGSSDRVAERELGGTALPSRRGWRQRCGECVSEVLLPVIVVLLGVGFSLAALWVSLSKVLWPQPE